VLSLSPVGSTTVLPEPPEPPLPAAPLAPLALVPALLVPAAAAMPPVAPVASPLPPPSLSLPPLPPLALPASAEGPPCNVPSSEVYVEQAEKKPSQISPSKRDTAPDTG
jgi:hypothetical protein